MLIENISNNPSVRRLVIEICLTLSGSPKNWRPYTEKEIPVLLLESKIQVACQYTKQHSVKAV